MSSYAHNVSDDAASCIDDEKLQVKAMLIVPRYYRLSIVITDNRAASHAVAMHFVSLRPQGLADRFNHISKGAKRPRLLLVHSLAPPVQLALPSSLVLLCQPLCYLPLFSDLQSQLS